MSCRNVIIEDEMVLYSEKKIVIYEGLYVKVRI